jgi:hypothetical protein
MVYTKALFPLFLAASVAADIVSSEPDLRHRRLPKDGDDKQGEGGKQGAGSGSLIPQGEAGGGAGKLGGSERGNGGGNGGRGDAAIRGDIVVFADGSTLSTAGVLEEHRCKSWTNPQVKIAAHNPSDHGLGDEGCNNGNECNGGCCRILNHLVCDKHNDFPHVACVCNANTYDLGTKTIDSKVL